LLPRARHRLYSPPASLTFAQPPSQVASLAPLDATATGLMLLAFGTATRLAKAVEAAPKTYRVGPNTGEWCTRARQPVSTSFAAFGVDKSRVRPKGCLALLCGPRTAACPCSLVVVLRSWPLADARAPG
jgi:hypothetical protein